MRIVKNVIKTLIVVCIIGITSVFYNQVLATSVGMKNDEPNSGKLKETEMVRVADVNLNDVINSGKNFVSGTDKVDEYAGKFVGIGQILVGVGVGVVLVSFTVMGIKWIIASPDQKAKLKEQLIGLVVSSIVIFGAITIWRICVDIGKDVESKISENTTNKTILIANHEQFKA